MSIMNEVRQILIEASELSSEKLHEESLRIINQDPRDSLIPGMYSIFPCDPEDEEGK